MSKFLNLTKRCGANGAKPRPVINLSAGFGLAICVLIFIIGIIYLSQINGLATFGFKLQALEERAREIERINKKLDLEVAELQSLSRITGATRGLGMVKVDAVDYIFSQKSSVAAK